MGEAWLNTKATEVTISDGRSLKSRTKFGGPELGSLGRIGFRIQEIGMIKLWDTQIAFSTNNKNIIINI